jgi:Zn-dependent protease with chaperone function
MTTSLTSALLEATRFAPERDLQERLRSRFGLDQAYEQIPDEVRGEHEDFLARLRVSHVHVTQRTAPDLHRIVAEACERLGLERDVELLIDSAESINACAYPVPAGTTKRVVSVTAGAVKQLTPLQLRCVMGHELGHVAYLHPQFAQQVGLIYRDEDVPALLQSQQRNLGRLQEFSADRAGLLAVDRDLEVAAEAELRVATGLGPEHVKLDLAAYLDEIARIEEFDIADELFTFTHPLMPMRIRALQLFAAGGDCDGEIRALAGLMDFESGTDEAKATRDLLLSGGLLAAHADGKELDDAERSHLEGLVLPFTDDPEALLSRVQTEEDAVNLFNQSAKWVRESLGPERFDIFEKLIEVVLHDGEVTEGEWQFLLDAGGALDVPGPWIAKRLAKHDEQAARTTAPPRAFGLRFEPAPEGEA